MRRALALIALGAIACGGPDRGGNGARGPGNGRTDASPSDGSARDGGFGDGAIGDASGPDGAVFDSGTTFDGGPGAPTILMLSSNVTTLSEAQQLIISAVVTDPDGVDDLIGGSLIDPGTQNVYGAFATSAAEGSYQVELTWIAIDTVSPIDAPTSGGQRRFVARFYDVAGHAAERELMITLRCATSGRSACSGDCVDLLADQGHCGACRQPVPANLVCRNGAPGCADSADELCGTECADLRTSIDHCGSCEHQCPGWSGRSIGCEANGDCTVEDAFYTRLSCDTVCGNHSYACASATWYYYMAAGYQGIASPCADVPPEVYPTDPTSRWESVGCSCVHAPGGPMCTSSPEDTVTACTDLCSNDGDRYVDCEDYDCCSVVSCPVGTACNP